eukprot:m.152723 g.152723  ORF g.152723 m.152723 type:complete len:72 (-) comp16218_c1_seq2:1653-1868(-)
MESRVRGVVVSGEDQSPAGHRLYPVLCLFGCFFIYLFVWLLVWLLLHLVLLPFLFLLFFFNSMNDPSLQDE